MQYIFDKIKEERQRQNEKWGEQNHDNLSWLAIFSEEVGEIAKEVTKLEVPPKCSDGQERAARIRNLKTELIQTAAVAVQWLECMERNKL